MAMLSGIGILGYFGHILFQNQILQAPEDFFASSGYIKYLIGWLIILGVIIIMAFLNYRFVFLKLFYHENTDLKSLYWTYIFGLSLLTFNILQFRSEYFPDYADENIFITLLLLFFIVLYGYIADYFRTKRLQILLMKEKSEAELSMLKAQINPHFLFNALNTIYNEAHREHNENTASLIEKLSGILRFSVEESNSQFITVEREISFLEQYLVLQKARLPDRPNIKINYNINDDEQPAKIAPFLLIPFLENAFQYGISMDKNCFIDFILTIENSQLLFKITNSNFAKNTLKKGLSTGIQNVQKRLDLQYKNKYKLLINKSLDIFEVELKIDL